MAGSESDTFEAMVQEFRAGEGHWLPLSWWGIARVRIWPTEHRFFCKNYVVILNQIAILESSAHRRRLQRAPAIILRFFAAGAEALGSLFMSAPSILAYFKLLPARSEPLISVSSLRCDHCRREPGLRVHRYWRMRFCSSPCMTAHQQRLANETKQKYAALMIANYG